jgi:hypothetical protein
MFFSTNRLCSDWVSLRPRAYSSIQDRITTELGFVLVSCIFWVRGLARAFDVHDSTASSNQVKNANQRGQPVFRQVRLNWHLDGFWHLVGYDEGLREVHLQHRAGRVLFACLFAIPFNAWRLILPAFFE